ncbi:MAG: hypothetical protein JWO82_2395 [Akkermansiaceae bacterium]|nr:hypothetical protein [Akkermansiaceae bacterium]
MRVAFSFFLIATGVACAVQQVPVTAGDHVAAALEKARELRKVHSGEPVEIVFGPGTHRLDSPLHFGPEDSGSESAPLRLIAAPGAHPVLSGGRVIAGFKVRPDGRWEAHVDGAPFEQLWVGGLRAVRAREPNAGFFHMRNVREEKLPDGRSRMTVELEDQALKWLKDLDPATLHGTQMLAYHKWDNTRRFIGALAGRDFVTEGRGMAPWNTWDDKTGLVLENIEAGLDQPGEWFLSPEGTLTYIPRPGEDPARTEVVAPVAERLVVIDGHPGAKVSHLEIRGLSFQHAGWTCPPGGYDPSQAASNIEAVIQADHAEAISLIDCEVAHTGLYGIWFRDGCTGCRVEKTYLHDLGAGGVRIGALEEGRQTSGNTVENCIIRDAGKVFPCAVGVLIGFSGDNAIVHNEISHMPYTGVSVGWRWGYAASEAKRNRIEFNHIHDIGNGLLSDMGGIYTLGPSEGSVLRGNRIHDILSYDYGGWGLYNDEGSTGMLLEDNLVYRTTSGGYHEHYGKENIVRNNIFAFARDQQLQFTRPEDHVSFHFTGNIVLWEKGPLWTGGSQGKGNYEVDRNILWPTGGGEIVSYGRNFDDWQKAGRDVNSLVADPLFVDPAHGDFHFKDPSVAAKIGFRPFDLTAAGVDGEDEVWRKLAKETPPDWIRPR